MRSTDFVPTERRKPVLDAIGAIHILQAPLDATQKDLATQILTEAKNLRRRKSCVG